QPQDQVVLYIAGHGAPDPNDPRNLYLLTYDTKLDDMGGTAFPMWQLQDVFTRVLKAKRVITFADTCHSYGFSGERRGKKSNNVDKATAGNQSPMALPGLAERLPLSGIALRQSASARVFASSPLSDFFALSRARP